MTALARFLVRCEHDSLPGFCVDADCPHWDWRDNDGNRIDEPLSQAEIAALLGVSRQRVTEIEKGALAKFVKRLRVRLDIHAELPRLWWRSLTAEPMSDRRPNHADRIAKALRVPAPHREKDQHGRWRQREAA